MNISDAPQWIRDNYSSEGNMGEWANKLDNAVEYIEPYLEKNFCNNHFGSDLGEEIKWKKMSEGMWHLHVLWALNKQGINLKKPYTNDDVLITFGDKEIGVEITFSNWGDYRERLALTHKRMGSEIVEINKLSADIVNQAMKVLDSKNNKLILRRPEMPRIVVLNEIVLANGFEEWNGKTSVGRRSLMINLVKSRRYQGMVGFTYDYVSYHDYFIKPDITLYIIDDQSLSTLNPLSIAKFFQK